MSTSSKTTISHSLELWSAMGRYYTNTSENKKGKKLTYTAIVLTDIDMTGGNSWSSPDDPDVQEEMVQWARKVSGNKSFNAPNRWSRNPDDGRLGPHVSIGSARLLTDKKYKFVFRLDKWKIGGNKNLQLVAKFNPEDEVVPFRDGLTMTVARQPRPKKTAQNDQKRTKLDDKDDKDNNGNIGDSVSDKKDPTQSQNEV